MNETPSAFSISQDEIDHLLRVGSNSEDARMKIVTEFSKNARDYADILKTMYHGGYGIETGAGKLAAWYAEDGIHLARGVSAEYATDAQIVSWEDAAERVNALLEQGRFATNVEIAEAPGLERRQVAESLWYLYQAMSDEAREPGWLPTIQENGKSGFPDDTERLNKLLEPPEARQIVAAELEAFTAAWRQDRSLMRFRTYRPDDMLRRVEELSLPRREYVSDMAELPAVKHFITEDEINTALSRGGSYEGSAGRIYSFWQQGHTPKEKEKFIRDQYGIGGHNSALSHNFDSWIDYSSKGIRFRKVDCGTIEQPWAKIVRRLDDLIAGGRYLPPAEVEKYESDHLEQAAEPDTEPEAAPEEPAIEEPERRKTSQRKKRGASGESSKKQEKPAETREEPHAKPVQASRAKPEQPSRAKPEQPSRAKPAQKEEEAPAKPAESLSAERRTELRAMLGDSVADDPELRFVMGCVEKYKTKLGLNNALVKRFGNQKASEIYQKLKPLLSAKKAADGADKQKPAAKPKKEKAAVS